MQVGAPTEFSIMRVVGRHARRTRPRQWLRGTPRMYPGRGCAALSCDSLTSLFLSEASRRVQTSDLRPSDLTEACIAQMGRSSWLNSFVERCPDSARSQAEAADLRQANGTLLGPLDGIPYAAKDNLCTLGVPTTASSAILENFTPSYDSTATRRLKRAGTPLLGKTNMDEFGMGSGTLFSVHGPTLNPWSLGDPSEGQAFIPGGSSGGSAAAVSSGSCFFALGSDTGGSVRMPGAFCGIVGFKPTYGLIPRHGLIAYASSLDTIGIMTRSVLDSAMVLDVIAGADSRDSTCAPPGAGGWPIYGSGDGGGGGLARALVDASRGDGAAGILEGVTVGIPVEFNVEGLHDGVCQAWENTARAAAALGALIVEVSVPSIPQALGAYSVITNAETSSNLSRYDGLRYGARTKERGGWEGVLMRGGGEGQGDAAGSGLFEDQGGVHEEITRTRTVLFGDEAKRRILAGSFVLSPAGYRDYYAPAVQVLKRIRREMHAAMSVADVLLTPTTPFPAFPYGAPADTAGLLNDALTVPANLAGVPAISIPVSTVMSSGSIEPGERDGLPVSGTCALPLGMQIMGRPFGEAAVLRVAHALERHFDFASLVPERVRQAR